MCGHGAPARWLPRLRPRLAPAACAAWELALSSARSPQPALVPRRLLAVRPHARRGEGNCTSCFEAAYLASVLRPLGRRPLDGTAAAAKHSFVDDFGVARWSGVERFLARPRRRSQPVLSALADASSSDPQLFGFYGSSHFNGSHVLLWFRGEDRRFGLATSRDGHSWTRHGPIAAPQRKIKTFTVSRRGDGRGWRGPLVERLPSTLPDDTAPRAASQLPPRGPGGVRLAHAPHGTDLGRLRPLCNHL